MLPRIPRVVAGLAMTVVMASPLPTSADQRVGPPTLDEATFLRRVRERSPRRQVHDDRRRAARAAIDVAAVRPNPTLAYEREAIPALDVSEDFVRLGWTLDLGGRRGLATSAARAGADAEVAGVDREAAVLELDARAAYLDAAYARQLLVRLDDARAALVAVTDALRARARQGDASDYDAERAALELETLDDERASAQIALDSTRLRLGELIGEPTTAYDASGELVLPRPPDSALALARPDIDAARARAREADRELAAARRRWIPRLELVVGLKASSAVGVDGVGYIVGVGGELPLLDRGAASAARSTAEARRWRSEAAALTTEATAEVERARRELVARVEHARTFAAGPARRALDLARRATVAYREGDRPILELLDVHRTARHAALRSLELTYLARRAELALHRALGRTP